MSRPPPLASLLLLAFAACRFQPDLERFPPCAEDGSCGAAEQCWTEQWRCVPICGEQADCDAGANLVPFDAGNDAGDGDAGTDGSIEDAGKGPLRLDGGAPTRAVELTPYYWRFQAFGGAPPYSFSRDGGLPSGVLFTSDGELTGPPAVVGSFPLQIFVADQEPSSASAVVSLRVAPLLRIGNKLAVADALSNNAYNEQLYATGGVGPHRWSIDAGSSLPGTMQLTTSGAISGSAPAGDYSFGVVLSDTDSPPQVVRKTLALTVRGNPLGAEFFTQQLADGRVGTQYDQQLRAAGGSPPLMFTHIGGDLPPGVTFSGSLLTGVPTDAGTYQPEFQVKDSVLSTQNKTFTITIF